MFPSSRHLLSVVLYLPRLHIRGVGSSSLPLRPKNAMLEDCFQIDRFPLCTYPISTWSTRPFLSFPILFTALPSASALPRFTPNILLRRRLESTLSIRHRWRVKKEDRPDLFSPRAVPVCLSIQIDFTLFLRRSRTKVDRPTSTVGASIAIH